MTPQTAQTLLPLAVVVLVVFRFARRELRERTVRLRTLWIRPAVLLAILAGLVAGTVVADRGGVGMMAGALAGGVALGALTGGLIVKNTALRASPFPAAIRAQGSRRTFAIWCAALLVRLAARFVLPHGADPRAQLPLDCGIVAAAAIAFTVIAIAFARAIAAPAAAAVASEPAVSR